MTSHEFDEIYFERGVENRVSGYTDYRWRPEYVMPMANWLKSRFTLLNPKCSYLDYGCAKGFLVKALQLLDCVAYGYDISDYAIKSCEPEVKNVVSNVWEFPDNSVNVVIAKDVLEHVDKKDIPKTLKEINRVCEDYLVAIVPLGDNGKFRIREYEMDVTHVTKEDEVWWIKQFNKAGFVCDEFYYSIPGIKDNWTVNYPYGNGIFILRKK